MPENRYIQFAAIIRHDAYEVPSYEVTTNYNFVQAELHIRFFVQNFGNFVTYDSGTHTSFGNHYAKRYVFTFKDAIIIAFTDGNEILPEGGTVYYAEIFMLSILDIVWSVLPVLPSIRPPPFLWPLLTQSATRINFEHHILQHRFFLFIDARLLFGIEFSQGVPSLSYDLETDDSESS
ncbi:hypothetical protein ONZ45_g6854 [Pleurotus djamor]|nr:hypothetical protein ONZ45_g6854 [Pleurotus djamor]